MVVARLNVGITTETGISFIFILGVNTKNKSKCNHIIAFSNVCWIKAICLFIVKLS